MVAMEERKVARKFLAVAALSLLILGGCITWSLAVGERANILSHDVWHLQEALTAARGQGKGI